MSKRPEDNDVFIGKSSTVKGRKYFVVKNRNPSTAQSKLDSSSPDRGGVWFKSGYENRHVKDSTKAKGAGGGSRPSPLQKKQNKHNLVWGGGMRWAPYGLPVRSLLYTQKVDRRHLVRGNLSYAGFFANGRQEAQQKNNNRRLIAYAAGCTKPYEEVSACAHTRAACTAWGFKDAVRLLALYLLHCKNSFIVKQSRKEMGFTRAELVTSNLFADSVVTTKAVKLLNSTQSIFFSKKKKTNQPIAAEQLHCRSYLRQRLKTRLQAGLRRIDISETVYGSLPRLVRTAKNRKSTTGFWANPYSFSPLQPLLRSNFTVINFNILNTSTQVSYRRITKSALSTFPFLQLNRVAAHFTATVYTALILKESKALAHFIKKTLRSVHFKKHPFYFNFVGSLIRDTVKPQLHTFNCLGLSVVFRGKLGIGGNARKRALKYQTGMVSSSSKYVKLSRSIDVVRTKTGIVGFTVILAW